MTGALGGDPSGRVSKTGTPGQDPSGGAQNRSLARDPSRRCHIMGQSTVPER
ncbi:hypothetical protein ACFPN7_23295 [Amycolatopsis halotolerans]|uniref:hypothetical protein n=1 Tax=Amycolatopsis halotolerans TaxID=330083 RepID=UPI00360F7AAA